MKQAKNVNSPNMLCNINASQNDYYDIFIRAIEIDLENIKAAAGTGVAIKLISPSLTPFFEDSACDLNVARK